MHVSLFIYKYNGLDGEQATGGGEHERDDAIR